MTIDSWSNEDLEQWLKELGCGAYYKSFIENHISGDILLECDHDNLRSLGITKVGDRIRIYQAIQKLKLDEVNAGNLLPDPRVNAVMASLEALNREVTSPFLMFREYGMGTGSSTSSPNGDEATTKTLRRQASTLTRAQSNSGGRGGAKLAGEGSFPGISSPYVTSIQSMDVVKQNNLRFIYPEGHTKTVNIAGCHTATDIKNRALQKANPSSISQRSPADLNGERYSIYVTEQDPTSSPPYRLLSSQDLFDISQSADLPERKRLIICEKDHIPTAKQLAKSEEMMNTNQYFSANPAASEMDYPDQDIHHSTGHGGYNYNTGAESRKYSEPVRRSRGANERISGQRPPSELISSNLAHYFPEVKHKELEQTVRNSIRFSKRLSRLSSRHSTIWSIPENDDAPPIPIMPVSATVPGQDATLRAEDLSSTDRSSLSRLSALSQRLSNLRFSKIRSPSFRDEHGRSGTVSESGLRSATGTDEDGIASPIEEDESESSDGLSDEDIDAGEDYLEAMSCPSKWIKGKLIGSGSFGTVYLGMNSFTGELMAVKQVELPSDEAQDQKHKQSMVEALQREMNLLRDMQHENVVSYLGSNSEGNVLNIFLEYVAGGSVASMLLTYGVFEEPLIKNFVKQILNGLNYLHEMNIIHRDIKGANVLVDDKGHIKISDFGISKKIETELHSNRVSLQGSVFWMAPEVVKQKPYTFKADIWSLGCLIVEMFTGTHPFPEFTQMQAIFRIGNSGSPAIPGNASDTAREFLTSTFAVDPDKRPSAADLLQHHFLSE